MSKKEVGTKEQVGNGSSESTTDAISLPENECSNTDRRAVIKRTMQLAAAAYVAPATLQLLTATRATAQSAEAAAPAAPPAPPQLIIENQSDSSVELQLDN